MLAPVSEKLRKYLGDVVVSPAEIRSAVKSLAERIEDYMLPGDFGIVPVMPKGSVFSYDLIRAIRIPVRVFPAFVTSKIISKTKPAQQDQYVVDCKIIEQDGLPEKLLVVTTVADNKFDIMDFVRSTIFKDKNVRSVDCCSLIQTSDSTVKNLMFSGLSLDAPTQSMVGYGISYKGYFSQLPCIVKLTKEF